MLYIFGFFQGCFFGFYGLLSKFLWLLPKVTKVTTEHQKLPKMGQNSIQSFFFAQRAKKSPCQSLLQERAVSSSDCQKERLRKISNINCDGKKNVELNGKMFLPRDAVTALSLQTFLSFMKVISLGGKNL